MRSLALCIARFAGISLLAGLLAATLVRLAPGYGVDERELDTRYSAASIEAIRRELRDQGLLSYYTAFLVRLLKGDLGRSTSLARPVRELLAERFPVTLASVGGGLTCGWIAALALAIAGARPRKGALGWALETASGGLLCLPAGVLAMAALWFDAPAASIIALVIGPRVHRYASGVLEAAWNAPHVAAAAARGLRPARIFCLHVAPGCVAPLIALCGVTVSMAFGAAIPIEAIADQPGVGQLAWQAAMSRDLPLLVSLTLVVALLTLAANTLADMALALDPRRREQAA